MHGCIDIGAIHIVIWIVYHIFVYISKENICNMSTFWSFWAWSTPSILPQAFARDQMEHFRIGFKQPPQSEATPGFPAIWNSGNHCEATPRWHPGPCSRMYLHINEGTGPGVKSQVPCLVCVPWATIFDSFFVAWFGFIGASELKVWDFGQALRVDIFMFVVGFLVWKIYTSNERL